jgi:glycosyltransferase 2 family protein
MVSHGIRSRPTARRRIVQLAQVTLGTALLVGLVAHIGHRPIAEAFGALAWWWLPVLLAMRIFGVLLQSQRWRLFLRGHRIEAPSAQLFRSYWIARFFNNFLPGQVGGDAYRILYGLDPGAKKTQVASSVFMERVAGLIGLMFVAAIGGYASFELLRDAGIGGLPTAASIGALMLLVLATSRSPAGRLRRAIQALPASRIGAVLSGVLRDLLVHVDQRRELLVGIALSVAFYVLMALESWLAFFAFGVEMSFSGVLVVVPTIALLISLPITINGWGTAEAACVLLYTQLGVADADALSIALLSRANLLLMGGMGGLLYLWQSWHAAARRPSAMSGMICASGPDRGR